MRSAFFPFHVATSGMFAARANLNTVAHNISNAEIPGFSRQQTVQSASRPLHLWDSRGMYGTGAQTTAIIQNRDRFLDMRFWHQRAIMGEHATKATHLSFVETVFNNLPDAGILRAFNDFFGRIADLEGNVPDATFRTNVITGADALAEMVRHNALALQRQQLDLNREVADVVMIINSLGSQLASVNQQIAEFERDGSNANDLRDRRNLLIDELSQFVNVDVTERDFSTPSSPNDRRTTIMINGHDFVRHDLFTALELVPRQAGQRRNEMDVDGLYDIQFVGGQGSFDIYNHNLRGALRGLIDLRDGNNSVITMGLQENHIRTVAVWPPGFFTNAPDMWQGEWPPIPGFVPGDPDTWPPGVTIPGFVAGDPATHPTLRQVQAASFDAYNQDTWPIGSWAEPRGGVTSNYKGIPFYMNQLNHLVRTFARAINEGLDAQYRPIPGAIGHIHGFDGNGHHRSELLFTFTHNTGPYAGETATFNTFAQAVRDNPENPLPSNTDADRMHLFRNITTGAFMTIRHSDTLDPNFTPPAGWERVENDEGFPMYTMGMAGMNALNFKVNPALIRNNTLLATNSHQNIGESDNAVVKGFNVVGTFPHLFREGRLEDFVIAVSDHLAVDTNQAINFALSFEEITMQTHNQRLSVKGVDINEEMMDLVRFQHMFTAASRLINVIDSVYDTLINRLGNF